MVRTINLYGNPILNKICVPCEPKATASFLSEVSEAKDQYWSDEVIEVVQDLKDTALNNAANTLGLAAPQIWWKDLPCPAIFVIRINAGNKEFPSWAFTELINPKIITSGKAMKNVEECLSIPNYSCLIKRKANVLVDYQLLTGPEVHTTKLFGRVDMNSIVIQHEYDHLIGKLIKK